MKSVLASLAATAGFFILLSVQATATPIRPDLQKVLAQSQEATIQFAPARAGWQGPEMNTTPAPEGAGSSLARSANAKAMRTALVAAAIPDPRLLLVIGLLIFLLRRRRKAQPA